MKIIFCLLSYNVVVEIWIDGTWHIIYSLLKYEGNTMLFFFVGRRVLEPPLIAIEWLRMLKDLCVRFGDSNGYPLIKIVPWWSSSANLQSWMNSTTLSISNSTHLNYTKRKNYENFLSNPTQPIWTQQQ